MGRFSSSRLNEYNSQILVAWYIIVQVIDMLNGQKNGRCYVNAYTQDAGTVNYKMGDSALRTTIKEKRLTINADTWNCSVVLQCQRVIKALG